MKRPKRQSWVCLIILGSFLCGFILQLLNRLNCFWDAENLAYDKDVTFTDEELFSKVERIRGCSTTWKDEKGMNGLWGKINSPGESLKNIWYFGKFDFEKLDACKKKCENQENCQRIVWHKSSNPWGFANMCYGMIDISINKKDGGTIMSTLKKCEIHKKNVNEKKKKEENKQKERIENEKVEEKKERIPPDKIEMKKNNLNPAMGHVVERSPLRVLPTMMKRIYKSCPDVLEYQDKVLQFAKEFKEIHHEFFQFDCRNDSLAARNGTIKRIVDKQIREFKKMTEEFYGSWNTTNLCPSIPHLLHQTWKSRELLPSQKKYRQTWIDTHDQTWTFTLWTDDDNRDMMEKYFPWFLCIYDQYDVPVKKADVIRPFYMLLWGGIYSDLDVDVIKPFEPVIEGKHVVLPVMGNDTTYLLDRHGITNMFYASVPGHIWWLYLIKGLFVRSYSRAWDINADTQTGPVATRKSLDAYVLDLNRTFNLGLPEKQTVIRTLVCNTTDVIKDLCLMPKFIAPYSWRNRSTRIRRPCTQQGMKKYKLTTDICKALFPEAHSITYWSHLWH